MFYKDNRKISIVMPAYKSGEFIAAVTKSRLVELKSLEIDYELIVVIDGKDTVAASQLKNIKESNLKVIHYDQNRGKGFAVKYGMLQSNGDLIGYIDVGLDIAEGTITNMYYQLITGNYDGVVGSKMHKRSKINYTFKRWLYSRGYNTFAKYLLGIKLNDTQVGAKLYKRELVEDVIDRLLVKRFAFEVEFLSVAFALGYTNIQEIPIVIIEDALSTISFRDGLKSLWDTVAIFYRLRILRYYFKDSSKVYKKFDLTLIS